MRILIIGGTGFIGPDVVSHLCTMSHEVILFHRGRTKANLTHSIKHILGDRHKLEDFVDNFRKFSPDVVLDMFPVSEQDARLIIKTFKGITNRVVAISSQDVYRAYGRIIGIESGPVDPIPLTESAPLRRRMYPYRGDTLRRKDDPMRWMDDYEKILIEKIILGDPDLPGTILRLPMVYGPRDRQHRIFPYLKRMDDDRPAILLEKNFAKWRWSRGYVGNVAFAIALACSDERAKGRIYNVGETETITMAQWIEKIGRLAEWQGKVVIVNKDKLPDSFMSNANYAQHLAVNTTRIREELGYKEQITQDETIIRTIAWERANPPQKIAPSQFDYKTEDKILGRLNQ